MKQRKELPERLDEIREIFHNHPANQVDSGAIKLADVNREGLVKFLQEDRQFSQRRMDSAFATSESLQEDCERVDNQLYFHSNIYRN